jgi:hypothetical protein
MELRIPTVATEHWLEEVRRRWTIRVRLRACQPVGLQGRRLLQLIEISARPPDSAALVRYLHQRPEIEELAVVSSAPGHTMLRVVTAMPPACGHVVTEGGVCSNCRFLLDRSANVAPDWTVVMPAGPRLRRFLDETLGVSTGSERPVGIRPYRPGRDLTPRQLAALGAAHRMGYYGFPRRAHLGEVAKALGISRSATAELLRAGEAKLVAVGLEILRDDGAQPPDAGPAPPG